MMQAETERKETEVEVEDTADESAGAHKKTWLFAPTAIHWKHLFGGIAFILIILLLVSGTYMTFYYEPALDKAYKSVQNFQYKVYLGGITRNFHRWAAFLIFISVLIHILRSFFRGDYRSNRRLEWVTGCLLFGMTFLDLATGLILPWEWKGYWFMEMVPNYFGVIPVIGPGLKQFLIDAFTLPRTFILHILLLPLIGLVLIDLHYMMRLRKRGIWAWFVKHSLLSLPVIILAVYLAKALPIPASDPEVLPDPMYGIWIPAVEWVWLVLFYPFLKFKGQWIALGAVYLPLLLLFVLTIFPFFFRRTGERRPKKKVVKVLGGLAALLAGLMITGMVTYSCYQSPTLGCNGCHHEYSGVRMAIPPESFKDRVRNPLLNDNTWMMNHWYYPNVVW